jgi:hypothetical protein
MNALQYIAELQKIIIQKKQEFVEMKKKETSSFERIVLSCKMAKESNCHPSEMFGMTYYHLLEEKIHYESIVKDLRQIMLDLHKEIILVKKSIQAEYITFHIPTAKEEKENDFCCN